MKTILMTCGETSGEEHAARLVRELKLLDPSCRILAMGGERLRESGAEIIFPMKEFAFMGFSEIIAGLPKILALEKKLKKLIREGEVDLFIPVDYPGLNLRLAGYAGKKDLPVLYFISPQVWAWGGWRIGKMKRCIDLMAVILPFEEKFYRDVGIPVYYAGNPMAGSIMPPDSAKDAPGPEDNCMILLFPGSRRQEIRKHLPEILSAVKIIASRIPSAKFRLGLAPLISDDEIEIPEDLQGLVEISRDGVEELEEASLVIAASGTVTLQAAMSGTPTVVIYRTSAFTYRIGKSLVRVPWIAMPNLLAGKKVFPELIQKEAIAEKIANEAVSFLEDRNRYWEVSQALLGIHGNLYKPNGLHILAEKALDMCKGLSSKANS